ncbi:hypothetical protein ACQB60_16280 [Actinomycetota bacterium Odt1-20B]
MRTTRPRRRTAPAAATALVACAALAGAAPPAAADTPPVIASFGPGGAIQGRGFLPSHTVYVRIAVSGTLPCNGSTAVDLRQSSVLYQFTADPAGNLNASVDMKTIAPGAFCGGVIQGAANGEQVSVSAHDGRHGSDITGLLWSNTFTITATGGGTTPPPGGGHS